MDLLNWVLAAAVAVAIISVLIARRLRQRRRARDTARYEDAVARGELPLSLHPVIDPDKCIGCLTCISACPEGDILGEVGGKVMLVAPSHCIGHGRCAAECPSDAVKLVFGTAERGVELPEVSEFFESSRPGVHIIGELGGMGLIKNAITQGVQVSDRLSRVLGGGGRAAGGDGTSDVLIVGAGPAGLAAALGCRANGLSFRVVDQDIFGGTIAHYPRQKVVMTDRVELPIVGKFGKPSMSKEELLASWRRAAKKGDVQVEELTKVEKIEGGDGAFVVQTSRGAIRARKVVLAIGRRGTPRKLGVKGEELHKVSYRLIETEQYERSRVVVVGGGDSAIEAACSLASETEAEVVLSYRNKAFGKCRDANRTRIQKLAADRRLHLMMESEVQEITPTQLHLQWQGRPIIVPNDYVIVCAGGELPLPFLQASGIKLQRYHGTAPGQKAPRVPGRPSAKAVSAEERSLRRLSFILFTIGALIVAGLTVIGWDYYWLSKAERLRSPLHKLLRPAGLWGHGVGVVATLVMMGNFLYAARKRLKLLRGVSSIRRWLTFHQFVGFMSPLVISFHAAFQSNNLLATATAASLSVVVVTGIVGRFIYGLVPTRDGRAVEYADVVGRWERMKGRLDPLLGRAGNPAALRKVLELATAPAQRAPLPVLFARMPVEAFSVRWRLRHARRFIRDSEYEVFRDTFFQLFQLRRQVGFYVGLKRLLSTWRAFHALLAVFLVLMIAGHIGVALYLGYGWIFL